MQDPLKPQKTEKKFAGETALYLKTLADENVFAPSNSAEELLKQVHTDSEAARSALALEFVSIKFYEGMQKLVAAADEKRLQGSIAEEKQHVSIH